MHDNRTQLLTHRNHKDEIMVNAENLGKFVTHLSQTSKDECTWHGKSSKWKFVLLLAWKGANFHIKAEDHIAVGANANGVRHKKVYPFPDPINKN
jgi:hypothetical protein